MTAAAPTRPLAAKIYGDEGRLQQHREFATRFFKSSSNGRWQFVRRHNNKLIFLVGVCEPAEWTSEAARERAATAARARVEARNARICEQMEATAAESGVPVNPANSPPPFDAASDVPPPVVIPKGFTSLSISGKRAHGGVAVQRHTVVARAHGEPILAGVHGAVVEVSERVAAGDFAHAGRYVVILRALGGKDSGFDSLPREMVDCEEANVERAREGESEAAAVVGGDRGPRNKGTREGKGKAKCKT